MSKKLLALRLIVALICLPLLPARADDSDIFGAEVQPNVLIAIDNSGSMGDLIYADPYGATTTYAGTYVGENVYKKISGGYSVYANTMANVTSASAQTALSTPVIAATTSQQLPSNPTPAPSFMRKVLYWREVF